jgi:hypothetical protein
VTPAEMRAHANAFLTDTWQDDAGERAADQVCAAIWKAAAEICERLESLKATPATQEKHGPLCHPFPESASRESFEASAAKQEAVELAARPHCWCVAGLPLCSACARRESAKRIPPLKGRCEAQDEAQDPRAPIVRCTYTAGHPGNFHSWERPSGPVIHGDGQGRR